MTRRNRFILIVLSFVILIGFRGMAQQWFYDPFLAYFKHDYLSLPVPEIALPTYFLHLFLRYLINSIISLVILYLVFMKWSVVSFCIRFYVLAFILFGLGLFYLMYFQPDTHYLLLFYLRRFLIHPIFLLVLIPAFYIYNFKGD